MNNIVCPNCSHSFTISDTVDKELQEARAAAKKEVQAEREKLQLQMDAERDAMEQKLETDKLSLRKQMTEYKEKKEAELEAKLKQWEIEKEAAANKAKQKVADEYKVRMAALEAESNEKTLKLQAAEQEQLAFLRKQEAFEKQKRDLDIEIEKRLIAERKNIEQEMLVQEKEVFDLKIKEKDTQMESMRKTIDELRKKSEQGSMQAQGEAQELLLEETLVEHFPFDTINEVKKGAEGADCILEVKDRVGQHCGSIIFESKNAKNWSNAWIEKLKNDKRNKNADIAVLVTQVYPKNVTQFCEIDGVWVCGYKDVLPLVQVLRMGIMSVHQVSRSQENKTDKMTLLYEYLTSNEFKGQIEVITEGFLAMRSSIDKERITMEKIWKEREKQIQKVLVSTSGLYGSVKGIAGASIADIPLLDGE